MKTRWGYVLLGGAVGAGTILALLFWRKKRELTARGEAIRLQLEADRGNTEITQQMLQMRESLSTNAERIARESADQHIGEAYGLTPERIQALSTLAERLGVN